jgi:hypothetical protein
MFDVCDGALSPELHLTVYPRGQATVHVHLGVLRVLNGAVPQLDSKFKLDSR